MNQIDMTLQEFFEYAEVYEHSQDHYNFKKSLYELDLMMMHLESYDFSRENNLSLTQLDILMTESGFDSKRFATEVLFEDTVDRPRGLIDKIFHRIGKAIIAFFRNVFNIFTNYQNRKIKHAQAEADKMKSEKDRLYALVNVSGARQSGERMANQAADTTKAVEEGLKIFTTRLDDLANPIIQPIPTNADTSIKLIVDMLLEASGYTLNERVKAAAFEAMKESYEVVAPAILVNIGQIFDMLENLIDINTDAETTHDRLYNSFHLARDTYMHRYNLLMEKITEYDKKEAKMTVSEESLKALSDRVEKWDEILKKITVMANVGQLSTNPNIIVRKAEDFAQRSPAQNEKLKEFQDYSRSKSKTDDRLSDSPLAFFTNADTKTKFTNDYPVYVSYMHQLAVKLQGVTAKLTKSLGDHINWRKSIIDQAANIIDSSRELLDSVQETA